MKFNILRTMIGDKPENPGVSKKEKGFLLLDSLIAMVFFALAGMMIMATYSVLVGSTGILRQQTDATNLGRQEVEYIKQFDQYNMTRNNTAAWGTYIPATKIYTINNINYTVNTNFIPNSELPATYTTGNGTVPSIQSDNNITPIRVTVTWDYRGRTSTIEMETYIMK